MKILLNLLFMSAIFNPVLAGVENNKGAGGLNLDFIAGRKVGQDTMIPESLVTVRITSRINDIDTIMIFDKNREKGLCKNSRIHPRVFYIKLNKTINDIDFITNIQEPCISGLENTGIYEFVTSRIKNGNRKYFRKTYKVRIYKPE